jgi:hypothetical protein
LARHKGKSDPLDAVSAARAAQSGRARGAPKGRDGAVEAIRALMVAKRSAMGERTRTINQARALILTGPDDLRARFAKHTPAALVAGVASLRPRPGDVPGYATRVALRELGRRAVFLDGQLERLDELIVPLAGMADRFAAALDCADTGFLPDGVLDELPLPAQAGDRRIAGIDLNKPRIRAALSAALALAPAPGGFTAAEHAARVRQITGQDSYTTRQAAYDLRKLRGKQLVDKPGRTRRYHVSPASARTISALLTLRDHVIAPILAGVRSPRMGRKPKPWTAVDRDYENLRIGMQTLFQHVGIETQPVAA